MRNVIALTQRELMTSFFSPVAYIVAAIFLIATGYLFMSETLVEGSEATMRLLLNNMAMVLVFAVPLLTMRVLSDEYASGTIEALMTAPVTDIEVILGKFFGVFVFYVSLLLTTFIFVWVLFRYGANDVSLVVLGYLGMLLLGALYVAIGIFASALTRYQLVAALIGIAMLGLLTRAVDYLAGIQGGAWRVVLGYINILHQFDDFSKGIFDSQSLIFFLSATVFFLFLAVKVLESRRWR